MMQMALFMLTLIVSHLLCVTVNWDGTLMCFWSNTSNIFGARSFQVAALACDQLREDGPLKTVFRSSSFVEVSFAKFTRLLLRLFNKLYKAKSDTKHLIKSSIVHPVDITTKSDKNKLNHKQFSKVHPVASSTAGPAQEHRSHWSCLCQYLQVTV